MVNQSRSATLMLYEKAQSSRQMVKFLTVATMGVRLLYLSGLTLTGRVIVLNLTTPVVVLFSPILVPATIAMFLASTGFLFSGGCGAAAITALPWIYSYMTGKHPPGADLVNYARTKIAAKARDMKERAKEYGQYVQHKSQEATQATS